MAYLDNTTITVDAILTKKGREKLAAGQPLNITQFALGDDEIDYDLYDAGHPKGSAFYDSAILATPILEASPDETQALKYKLVTLPKGTTRLPIVSINTSTKVVNINPDYIPKDLEVGDFMPLAGETPIPNVPTELHMVLAQRVAQRVLEALGDSEGLNNATAKVAEMEMKLTSMMDNRVEGAPRKIVNRALMTGVARNRRR
jgi:hypothetical protein